MTRRARFPPPDPAGFGSPASSVLSRRSDSHRPFRLLAFVRSAVPRTAARHEAAGSCCCRLLFGTAPVPQSSAFGSHSWRHAGSPRFLGNPFAHMPCSSTPADPCIRPIAMHGMLPSAQLTASAPLSVTFRGSMTRPAHSLSTLHGSDYSNTAQDSLPAGGQPWRDRTLTCRVASGGFHSVSSTHIVFPSSRLFLAHQPP